MEQVREAAIHWDDTPTPPEMDDTVVVSVLNDVVAPMAVVEEETVECVLEDVVGSMMSEKEVIPPTPEPPVVESPPLSVLPDGLEQEQEQQVEESKDAIEEEEKEEAIPPLNPSRSGTTVLILFLMLNLNPTLFQL